MNMLYLGYRIIAGNKFVWAILYAFGILPCYRLTWSILVVARSKAWVCGRYVSGITGSNPIGGIDIRFLWVFFVARYGICEVWKLMATSCWALPTSEETVLFLVQHLLSKTEDPILHKILYVLLFCLYRNS